MGVTPEDRGEVPELDLEDLYRRFAPQVLRRGRYFLGPSEAEELVHEVFVRALEQKDRFRGESSPATWLFRIATHLCLNRLRDRKRQAALLVRHGPTVWAQSDPGSSPEARAFLSSLWRTLDEELAMIGTLYYVDGLTTADIGEMLEVSDRTIANRLKTLTELARRHAGVEDGA
ncbi:MAG: RNA polymerase sigma factor [Myxococcota bacterium]